MCFFWGGREGLWLRLNTENGVSKHHNTRVRRVSPPLLGFCCSGPTVTQMHSVHALQ